MFGRRIGRKKLKDLKEGFVQPEKKKLSVRRRFYPVSDGKVVFVELVNEFYVDFEFAQKVKLRIVRSNWKARFEVVSAFLLTSLFVMS